MVVQAQKGFYARDDSVDLVNLEQTKEYGFSVTLLNAVEQKFNLVLPIAETACLTIQLLENNLFGEEVGDSVSTSIKNKSSFDVAGTTKKFISASSLHLHPSLQTNERLLEFLIQHLIRLTYKIENRVNIYNPIMGEIQEKLPETYRVAKKYSPIIENGLGISLPDEEVGYIAVYLESALQKLQIFTQPISVVIVSTSDTATSLLLFSRIKAEFPDMIVEKMISLQEFPNWISKNKVNLIVSNTQVNGGRIPSVKVGNFLSNRDIARIKATIDKEVKTIPIKESLGILDWKPTLIDVLPKENIQLSLRAKDWREAVSKTIEVLVKSGGVEPHFTDAVIKQLEENGAYMVIAPGIALLHAKPCDGANRVSFCLCRFDPPIEFNHPNNDPVDIVIAFGAINPHSHEQALNEIVRLLENDEFLRQIRNARFPVEIIQFIKTINSYQA